MSEEVGFKIGAPGSVTAITGLWTILRGISGGFEGFSDPKSAWGAIDLAAFVVTCLGVIAYAGLIGVAAVRQCLSHNSMSLTGGKNTMSPVATSGGAALSPTGSTRDGAYNALTDTPDKAAHDPALAL